VAFALLLWTGLVLTPPAEAPEASPPVVARVRLGAGDAVGARMFGRPLHRRRILAGEVVPAPPEPFDLRRWLTQHGAALR
jgi:hypothetical protein